jgi:DNA end-binding protein Ku
VLVFLHQEPLRLRAQLQRMILSGTLIVITSYSSSCAFPRSALPLRSFPRVLPSCLNMYAYTLLHKALSSTGKVIAKVAIRSRKYAAVRPDGLFLTLELMHFATEVLDPSELRLATAEILPKELAMATTLISAMTSEWQPEKYADRYQDAVREVIEAKVAARPLNPKAPAKSSPAGIIDLLAVLQESLKANTDLRKKPAAGTDKPAKARESMHAAPQRALKPKKSKAA